MVMVGVNFLPKKYPACYVGTCVTLFDWILLIKSSDEVGFAAFSKYKAF